MFRFPNEAKFPLDNECLLPSHSTRWPLSPSFLFSELPPAKKSHMIQQGMLLSHPVNSRKAMGAGSTNRKNTILLTMVYSYAWDPQEAAKVSFRFSQVDLHGPSVFSFHLPHSPSPFPTLPGSQPSPRSPRHTDNPISGQLRSSLNQQGSLALDAQSNNWAPVDS